MRISFRCISVYIISDCMFVRPPVRLSGWGFCDFFAGAKAKVNLQFIKNVSFLALVVLVAFCFSIYGFWQNMFVQGKFVYSFQTFLFVYSIWMLRGNLILLVRVPQLLHPVSRMSVKNIKFHDYVMFGWTELLLKWSGR